MGRHAPEAVFMTLKQTAPIWYQLATPEERNKIDELDRSIADLRRQRQAIINRAKPRTHVWLEHRGTSATHAERKSAALRGRTRRSRL